MSKYVVFRRERNQTFYIKNFILPAEVDFSEPLIIRSDSGRDIKCWIVGRAETYEEAMELQQRNQEVGAMVHIGELIGKLRTGLIREWGKISATEFPKNIQTEIDDFTELLAKELDKQKPLRLFRAGVVVGRFENSLIKAWEQIPDFGEGLRHELDTFIQVLGTVVRYQNEKVEVDHYARNVEWVPAPGIKNKNVM